MRIFYLVFTVLCLTLFLVLICQSGENLPQKEHQDIEIVDIHPLDKIILLCDEDVGKNGYLLVDYIQKNPGDEQWVNIYVGWYYKLNKKYWDAEKYFTQATYFDYSMIDGLMSLTYVIPHKILPEEQMRGLGIECWNRIKKELPLCTAVSNTIKVIETFPKATNLSRDDPVLFTEPNERLSKIPLPNNDKNHPLIQAKKYEKEGKLDEAIKYYKNFAYEFVFWPAGPAMEIKTRDIDVTPIEITSRDGSWAGVFFNKIASCYIKKAENLWKEFKNTNEQWQKQRVANIIIQEYKKAIYYLWAGGGTKGNLPKITELRQKIKEIESQIKQEKDK